MTEHDDTDRPLTREERIAHFGETHVERTEWSTQERRRVRDLKDEILAAIEERDDAQVIRHGNSIDRDGLHELRFRVQVAGQPFQADDREQRDVYACGGCDRLYDEPFVDDDTKKDVERCPYCGTRVGYEGTELRTVVF